MQGTGTANDPYLVETAEDLNSVRNDLTAHYLQVADIDLSSYSESEGWSPIGDSSTPFAGGYDGGGHKVVGLTINRPESDYQGLFGSISGAEYIRDIVLEGAYVHGGDYTGVLAGGVSSTPLVGVQVTGSQVIGNARTGGLVGLAGVEITDCSFSGDVTGGQYVGGLVGYPDTLTLQRCTASGNVFGASWVGGLVGGRSTGYSPVYIEFCKANCTVNCTGNYAGGFVGCMGNYTRIGFSYFSGTVSGVGYVGGLLGYGDCSNTSIRNRIEDSYSTGEVTGQYDVGGIAGCVKGPVGRCYSTCKVAGTENVGGIAGRQAYSGVISNCFALNPSIERLSGTSVSFGRVVGSPYNDTSLENNYARDDMAFITSI